MSGQVNRQGRTLPRAPKGAIAALRPWDFAYLTSSSEVKRAKTGLCLVSNSLEQHFPSLNWSAWCFRNVPLVLPFWAHLKIPLRLAAGCAPQVGIWSKDKWSHCLLELHLLMSPHPKMGGQFSPCISGPTLDPNPAKVFSRVASVEFNLLSSKRIFEC